MKKHILQENYERFFGKREFGDPLPTFEDVMEQHQVNKLKEGWWDVLSKKAQSVYKKAHPGSQQAQSAKDTDGGDDAEHEKEKKKLDQEIQALDDAKWKAVDSGDGAAIRNWGEKLQKAKAKREKMSRTGNELNQETLTIDGRQFRILNESVEKQPKSTYEFSEFYQRFKK